jgi:hypothetical protein
MSSTPASASFSEDDVLGAAIAGRKARLAKKRRRKPRGISCFIAPVLWWWW